ncbi:hypothetical protein [Cellulomonas sp. URHB0016]
MGRVLLAGLALVEPGPSSSGGVTVTDATEGSPGFIGFVVTFVLALAAVGLFLSLTKQLRIVDRRAKQLGLDDEAPRQDRSVVDAGAAGPDLEVDADLDTTLRHPPQDPDDRPRDEGGGPQAGGPGQGRGR